MKRTGTPVYCDHCDEKILVSADKIGKTVQCPTCEHKFVALRDNAREENPDIPIPQPKPWEKPQQLRKPKKRRESETRDRERDLLSDDYGYPWYLWALGGAPWLIPVLTLGGCLWFIVASAASGLGMRIAYAKSVPVLVRLYGLIILNA